MSEPLFVGKINVKEMTNVNGEKWIKRQISLNQDDLALLQGNLNQYGFVYIDYKKSKKGKEYLQIDTWGSERNKMPEKDLTDEPPEIF